MNIEEKIEKNVKLDKLTTFRIGGPAKYFIKITNKQDLLASIDWAKAQQEKIYILGAGSNILVNDNGVDGLVIKLANADLQLAPHNSEEIIAGAGVMLGQVINFAKDNNLAGLEWGIGIPGTIGGSVRGNAGAYGGCMADSVLSITAYDLEKSEFREFSKENCNFSYRSSIFKENPNLIVWQAKLELSHSVQNKIKELMDNYLQQRLAKQPKYPSAGCIFKNLMVSDLVDKAIVQQAVESGKSKEGKLACGYLIDLVEFKGKQVGGALVTPEHGNFIVNYDQATAQDVQSLINEIKQAVKEKFGINLQEELQYFGF